MEPYQYNPVPMSGGTANVAMPIRRDDHCCRQGPVEPRGPGPIFVQIDQIHKALDLHEATLSDLRGRLEPVCNPTPPPAVKSGMNLVGAGVDSGSAMQGQLRTIAQRVRDLTEALETIRENLEV
jgi:hypothetical protein